MTRRFRKQMRAFESTHRENIHEGNAGQENVKSNRMREKNPMTKQTGSELILGCHMSVAGGYHVAVDKARQETCDCVQVFTAPPRAWPSADPALPPDQRKSRLKPITQEDAERFRKSMRERGLVAAVAHGSYLLNLASPDDVLWQRSIDSLLVELRRAEQLGIAGVVIHPGSYTTSDEATGLRRIAAGLKEAQRQLGAASVRCLLETTAGQGSNLGYRFEHLAEMLDAVADPDHFGVCIDTCHMFAAGYPMSKSSEFDATVKQLDTTVGLTNIHAIHLNDSRQPFGSRKDRHEQIGEGEMGLEPFRHLLNDERLNSIPMYLETPKGEQGDKSWDRINLETLRKLVPGT